MRFNYLTRGGNDMLSGRYPLVLIAYWIRSWEWTRNNAPFMCFWSRLIQPLQGDDISVVFMTIKILESVFFFFYHKKCLNLNIKRKKTFNVYQRPLSQCIVVLETGLAVSNVTRRLYQLWELFEHNKPL